MLKANLVYKRELCDVETCDICFGDCDGHWTGIVFD